MSNRNINTEVKCDQLICLRRSLWNNMKWYEMKWNGMKWNEMEWNGIKLLFDFYETWPAWHII